MENTAASEWLLLYVISKKDNITFQEISNELEQLWKNIQQHNSRFYISFGVYDNGHRARSRSLEQELMRFYDIGLIKIFVWEKYYCITEQGKGVIKEWWPKVKDILHPTINLG